MNILEIQNISKNYASHKALEDVTFSIPEQSIFGLLGPNGAGKTSLIRIITQITGADEGTILFNGQKLNAAHVRTMGYLPEERGLYKKMKVGEQLLYLARLKGLEKVDAIASIKLWSEKLEINEWLNKSVEDLSKGMQQKVQFIATVLHDPKLIILDEPFSGFDPINANIIKDQILELRERGSTIIFSTHRMESVEELCDNIVLINKSKKVLEGSVSDIKEAHKTATYLIEGKGICLITSPDFEVIDHHEKNGFFRATVKLLNNTSSTDLLRYLIGRVEINSFVEVVPSINEIFIKTVKESHHE